MRVQGQFKVRIKKKAQKVLDKIPAAIREKIDKKIKSLKSDPIGAAEGGPMEGYEDRYKFRQGGWRVIYEVDEDDVTVEVIKVGSRGDVYKD